MLGTEVQHLLGLGDAADRRAGQVATHADDAERRHHERVFGQTELDERAVEIQHAQEPAQIEIGRDGVEDQVEGVAQLLERVAVGGRVVVAGAQPQAVLHLLQALRQHRHLGAHRRGELDRHVAQTAEAHDGDPPARPGIPVPQRRVGGDARAQQRCGGIEAERVGNAQDVVLVDDDAAAVAAVGGLAVAPDCVVGADVSAAGAVLLEPGEAVVAFPAGVDEAAHTHPVTDLVPGDLRAHLGDHAGDLVSGNHRIARLAPLGAHGVDVGVADPGEVDVEPHIVRADVAPGDGGLRQRLGGRGRGVGGDGAHRAPLAFLGPFGRGVSLRPH